MDLCWIELHDKRPFYAHTNEGINIYDQFLGNCNHLDYIGWLSLKPTKYVAQMHCP